MRTAKDEVISEQGSADEQEGENVDFLAEVEDEESGDGAGDGLSTAKRNVENRADFLSATEIRHLTAAFDTCDAAETGELGFANFTKALAVMGKKVTRTEAQTFFEQMDVDKSGFITIDEWIGFYANNMVRTPAPLPALVPICAKESATPPIPQVHPPALITTPCICSRASGPCPCVPRR